MNLVELTNHIIVDLDDVKYINLREVSKKYVITVASQFSGEVREYQVDPTPEVGREVSLIGKLIGQSVTDINSIFNIDSLPSNIELSSPIDQEYAEICPSSSIKVGSVISMSSRNAIADLYKVVNSNSDFYALANLVTKKRILIPVDEMSDYREVTLT